MLRVTTRKYFGRDRTQMPRPDIRAHHTAMNNNFGSNSAWELDPTHLSGLRSHMLCSDDTHDSRGFDDMFDTASFRTSRSAFRRGCGPGTTRGPVRRSQTFYRGHTLHPNFGLPETLAEAHWAYVLPSQPTSASSPFAAPTGPHRRQWGN